jgi:hypothetical protein
MEKHQLVSALVRLSLVVAVVIGLVSSWCFFRAWKLYREPFDVVVVQGGGATQSASLADTDAQSNPANVLDFLARDGSIYANDPALQEAVKARAEARRLQEARVRTFRLAGILTAMLSLFVFGVAFAVRSDTKQESTSDRGEANRPAPSA